MSETLSSGLRFLVFAVVTLLATALLATTIGNYSFTSTQGYRAVFSDAVNLVHGDEVRLAGVRVGSIAGVKLVDGDKALVSFSVDKKVTLTTTTLAVIRYRNLIGQRYLAIVDGPSGGSTLTRGSTIPLERTRPALNLNELFNGFRPLLTALSPADVNKLSYELIQHFLDYEPFKLQVASAITGYGAFQLFFLCSANFILPDGTQTKPFMNSAKRCTNP